MLHLANTAQHHQKKNLFPTLRKALRC